MSQSRTFAAYNKSTITMIDSLQSLRGIFAIMIFLHHFTVWGVGNFKAGGDCGVAFFLMLSGFVMSAGYGKRVSEPGFSYRRFMRRRVVRIVPLHLLCLAVYIALSGYALTPGGWLRLVPYSVMMQSWAPVESVFFAGNPVEWCLSDLMFFYAVFPALTLFYAARRREFLIASGIAFAGCVAIASLLPERWVLPIVYISPVMRLVDFVAGMLAWHAVERLRSIDIAARLRALSFAAKSGIEVGAVLVVAVAVALYPDIPVRYSYSFWWWLPSLAVIMVFTLLDGDGGALTRMLDRRLPVSFGNVSFSFYMLHVLLISLWSRLVPEPGWGSLAAVLSLCIALSYIVYYCYERPVADRLLRRNN